MPRTNALTLQSAKKNARLLELVLDEIRLLHKEVHLLFPQEDLEDYAHPQYIKRAYKEAVKQYPPLSAL